MHKEHIIQQMKEIFKEIPFGIDHTLKVLKNAEDIMDGENVSIKERELISSVAILHDIGAVEAKRKYDSIEGVYQEKEGPAVARKILVRENFDSDDIERICYIIGNHHTPAKIDGLDFQIQWEADLLENLTIMDKQKEQQKIKKCIEENFKTPTGKKIAYDRFILELK
ncbi:HD domain-containing protein [Faecalicatena contorta]|uniref:HD domain-containing protein n=2 Tax=Faecalicatena contorta TaxID=39482 RepID=A0A315ZTH9_9FIRM|nr:metal dependent phosphohydrolase [Faecalicatena contorta]SUQ15561.1 HD domain-containing protein [Faecalicatena contorta]